jgi:hypothetical protein
VFIRKLRTVLGLLKNPYLFITTLGKYNVLNWMPDSCFLRISYRGNTGEKLNLKNPQTFNEKLQWLKLYDRNPLYTKLADKYEVREFVSKSIGDEYLVPLLGVYNSVDEIDFNILPERFVLKCTHDQGSVIICRDKEQFDIQKAKRFLNKRLAKNPFWATREWPYKNITPRIICERYLEQGDKKTLDDFKVLCFNGEAKLIEYHINRFNDNHTQDFYDLSWNKTKISQKGSPLSTVNTPKPILLEKMLRLSEILANKIPHVRVDWYIAGGILFFGEMTFFDASGFCPFDNPADDLLLGTWIDISKVGIV